LLAVLLAGSAVLAFAWAALPGRSNDLEQQGIDIVNHAILVHRRAHPVPAALYGAHRHYPQASHALAAWFMPVLGDNAIRAMDCAAWLTLLGLFAAQWTLLCRLLPAAPALAVLALWQGLRLQTRFSDWDFFHVNYYPPQALGTLGVWLQLAVLATPEVTPLRRCLRDGAAVLLAALAYSCHIVPGAVAFATLAVLHGSELFGPGRRAACLRLLLTGLVAAVTLLSSDQLRLMAGARTVAGGRLLYDHLWLLLLWVPTLLVACLALARGLRRVLPRRPNHLERVLTCALLAAGGIQGYLTLETLLGHNLGYYSAMKLYWYTFPLATLLWVGWLCRLLAASAGRVGLPRLASRRAVAAGCVLCAIWGLNSLVRQDPRRPRLLGLGAIRRTLLRLPPNPGSVANSLRLSQERDAVVAARRLAGRPNHAAPWVYFYDPAMPFGSLFASVVGLETHHDAALGCWMSLGLREVALADVSRTNHVGWLLLPRHADTRALGLAVPARPDGAFLRCDLRGLGAAGSVAGLAPGLPAPVRPDGPYGYCDLHPARAAGAAAPGRKLEKQRRLGRR
jgi:hypothetical protein